MQAWKSHLRSLFVPVPALSPRRYAAAWLADVAQALRGGNGELLPPTRLMFDGSQNADDFRRDGAEFLNYFIGLGGLGTGHRVLEIGCAIGRKALPLTRYLDQRGSYDGFDIVPVGIEWCRANVTPRFPNFRFAHADIFNTLYNPQGCVRAAEFRFPYADASFDFAVATSVFTHMLSPEFEHYVAETARVLAPGGRLLASFLLLDEEAERGIAGGRSMVSPTHAIGPCRVARADVPEAAVAYPVEHVREVCRRHGLDVIEPAHFGSWSGRVGGLSTQDILVVERRC